MHKSCVYSAVSPVSILAIVFGLAMLFVAISLLLLCVKKCGKSKDYNGLSNALSCLLSVLKVLEEN